jgi:hypothetical protein
MELDEICQVIESICYGLKPSIHFFLILMLRSGCTPTALRVSYMVVFMLDASLDISIFLLDTRRMSFYLPNILIMIPWLSIILLTPAWDDFGITWYLVRVLVILLLLLCCLCSIFPGAGTLLCLWTFIPTCASCRPLHLRQHQHWSLSISGSFSITLDLTISSRGHRPS